MQGNLKWAFLFALMAFLLGACDDESSSNDDADAGANLTWRVIPDGTFLMGSDAGLDNEQPMHSVSVTSFEMTQSEITLSQYKTCVHDGGCLAYGSVDGCNFWADSKYDNHPVNCINWERAVAFCEWAGGRLPSESEWEYAARSGGQDITYPWGNKEPSCDYVVMKGCSETQTVEVCSKPTGNTDQGLCDMAGNVWEWVQDRYHGSYDCDANPSAENCGGGGVAPDDGSAWEGTGQTRIRRGGGWDNIDLFLRTSYRYGDQSYQYDQVGFRCAR